MPNCQLNEPPFHQCCCVCKHHLRDYRHCTIDTELREKEGACICSSHKGWICAGFSDEGVYHSGWPEHSVGCELWHDIRR